MIYSKLKHAEGLYFLFAKGLFLWKPQCMLESDFLFH